MVLQGRGYLQRPNSAHEIGYREVLYSDILEALKAAILLAFALVFGPD